MLLFHTCMYYTSNSTMQQSVIKISFYIGCLFSLLACRKESHTPLLPEEKKWILDSMQTYYYWSDKIPGNLSGTGSAEEFFKSLLYNQDRFSYMNDPAHPGTEYSSFAWYGFEYSLLTTTASENGMTGVVTLTVPGGPAANMGIERGRFFTAVNDIPVTAGNLTAIQHLLRLGEGVRLTTANLQSGKLVQGETITIEHRYFTEQPVYMASVFNNGNKKAGYLFYNYFDGNFDKMLLDSMAKLKDAGIEELIIDLRYNPGGDVSSAAKLAAILAPVNAGQTFSIYQANSNGGRRVNSFQKAMQETSYYPNGFIEVASYRLPLKRVFILTTKATASASELLINTLKPYLPVVQIGETTTGKDMGGFPITDQRPQASITYVLHPLVFKLTNANGEGNYTSGISPDHMISELSALPIYPFGNRKDPLLQQALQLSIGLPASPGRELAPVNALSTFSSAQQRSSSKGIFIKR